MGENHHIGFTVSSRFSWGMRGSYFPVVLRVFVACMWFGSKSHSSMLWLLCIGTVLLTPYSAGLLGRAGHQGPLGCYHSRCVDLTLISRGLDMLTSQRFREHEELLRRRVTPFDKGFYWIDHLDDCVHSTCTGSSGAPPDPLCHIFLPFCRFLYWAAGLVSITLLVT